MEVASGLLSLRAQLQIFREIQEMLVASRGGHVISIYTFGMKVVNRKRWADGLGLTPTCYTYTIRGSGLVVDSRVEFFILHI